MSLSTTVATAVASVPAASPASSFTLRTVATEPPPAASPSPPPTPTARPTLIPASPSPAPTTVVDAGLECPAEPPVRPDYQRGAVGADAWPVGDTARTSPHLWLAQPVAIPEVQVNVTYPYGSDGSGRYLLHNGLDIVEPPGTPVLAVADGTVVVAGPDADRLYGWRCDWYGNLVVIELDQTWDGEPIFVLYGHVLDVGVAVGDRVETGAPLAVIGTGGVATAPHLHLEVRIGENRFGATRNPALWLEPQPGQGVIAGRLVDPDGRAWQGVTVTLIDVTGQSDFRTTWTYLDDRDHLVQPDEALGETFAWAGIPAGEYDVFVRVQDRDYRQRVTVADGQLTWVEIVTEAEPVAPTATP